MIFQRENGFRNHIYFLIGAKTMTSRVRRLFVALCVLRIGSELETIWREQRVLQLCSREDVDAADVIEAMLAEQTSREYCWFGRELSATGRAAFYAMVDWRHRTRLAQAIRRGEAVDTPRGFKFPSEPWRKLGANLITAGMFAWLTLLLFTMRDQLAINAYFSSLYIAASLGACVWFAHTCHKDIMDIRSTVDAANANLGPKRTS